MDLIAKVAYLKGLAEGAGLTEDSKKGKVLAEMISLMEEMAYTVEAISDDQEELFDYVESIDEDLAEVEELLFDEDDDDCRCGGGHGQVCGRDADLFTVDCPECGESVSYFTSILDGDDDVEVLCPVCDAIVYKYEADLFEDDDFEDDEDDFEIDESDIEEEV